jgi:enamine deaminase RidA (YjgF/YER057c/UK114 family)
MLRKLTRAFARGGDDWEVPLWNPYPQVTASDGLAFSRGQCAFDKAGDVVATGDLAEQISLAVQFGMRSFSELGMTTDNLTRSVLYYDAKLGFSEQAIEDMFFRCLGAKHHPSLVLVPLPGFSHAGMVQEIDLYGSTDTITRQEASSGNVVQAGDTMYLSGISASRTQGSERQRLDAALKSLHFQVKEALAKLNTEVDDIVKITTYGVPELLNSVERWKALVEARAGWFKARYPVITDVPLRGLDNSDSDLRIDVIAKAKTREDRDVKPVDLKDIGMLPFASPHPAGLLVGKHFYVGGRMGLTREGEMLEPGVPEYQTRILMNDLGKLLAAVDMDYDHVIKKTTYFIGHRGVNYIRRNFSIRTAYYRQPGPASTGIVIDALPIKGAMLVSEAMAIRD